MALTVGDLRGLWLRSLIVLPDGRRDTTTFVAWLQGTTRFADLRQPAGRPDFSGVSSHDDLTWEQIAWLATQQAFAGVLTAEGDMFTWTRSIDFQPPSDDPDVGRLWFEPAEAGARHLVERGRDVDYVEHWHGQPGDTAPCWTAGLRDPESSRTGIIVRVGARFMLALSRANSLPRGTTLAECVAAAGSLDAARDIVACEVSLGRIDGGGWTVERSTLPYREGCPVVVARSGDTVRAGSGGPEWSVTGHDGDPECA